MIKDFKVYQELTRNTAQYPPEQGLGYTVLGVVGEWGEVIEVQHDRDRLFDEIGDLFWYIANVFYEIGDEMGIDGSLIDLTLSIDQAVYKLAETAKKCIRGGLKEERKEKIRVYLHTILFKLWIMLTDAGIEVWSVLQANISKLTKRKEEGTIRER